MVQIPKKTVCNFTLVELLVVVSILSILSSLLQPALKNVLVIAKISGCMSNLKNIASTMLVYAEDEKRFPPSYELNLDGTESTSWSTTIPKQNIGYDDLLAPYDGRGSLPNSVKTNWLIRTNASETPYGSAAYICPNEDVIGQRFPQTYFPNAFYALGKGYLGFQGPKWRQNIGLSDAWSERPEFYPDPQATIALVESPGSAGGYALGGAYEVSFPYAQSGQEALGQVTTPLGSRDRWHGGRWNYLFIDGHVGLLMPEETTGPAGNMGWQVGGMWSFVPGD